MQSNACSFHYPGFGREPGSLRSEMWEAGAGPIFLTSFQKANSIIVVNIYDSLISASPSAFSFYVDLYVGVREGREGQGLAI